MQAHPATRFRSRPAIQCAMDSKTLRRQNLAALEQAMGSLAAIERETGIPASYLSQIKNSYREMGDSTARDLETKRGLPRGWMDLPHESDEDLSRTLREPENGGNATRNLKNFTSPTVKVRPVVNSGDRNALTPVILTVPVLDIEASMGLGAVQPEYETIVGQLDLNENFVRANLPNISSPKNLRLITGLGDSMKGTYEDGSPLFVDTGVVEVKVDAVYAFALNEEIYVKRLQRLPDGTINVISDNERYPPYSITGKDRIRVIGRVVAGWNWFKL